MHEVDLDFNGDNSPEKILPALVTFLRARAAESAQSREDIIRGYAKTDLETADALAVIAQKHDRGRRRVELLDFEGRLSDAVVDASIQTVEGENQQWKARALAERQERIARRVLASD